MELCYIPQAFAVRCFERILECFRLRKGRGDVTFPEMQFGFDQPQNSASPPKASAAVV